jgi:hypothetical protein
LWRRHAKSQCKPLSRLINSFEKHRPGDRRLHPLLDPEDGTEGAREEDALDCGGREDEALAEVAGGGVAPM